MADNSSAIDNSNGVLTYDSPISKAIKFWLLLVGVTSAMPCYLLLIYYFLAHKSIRQALYNHIIIASLFVDFIILSVDLTCHLGFLRLGYLAPSTPALCLVWQLVDYGFWYGDLFLKSWAAIERHILIFHSHLLNTSWKRLLFHYLPLVFVTFYTPIVYTYLIFFYPAEHIYDYTVLSCSGPYYYYGIPAWLIWYESLFHYVIPIFILIIFSNALFIRIIIQKSRLNVTQGWRQYRKMTIQLVFVSVIYLFDLPYIIVTIVRWSGLADFGTDVQGPYFYYVNYIPIVLFPFAILGSHPKLVQQIIHRKRRRQIAVSQQNMTKKF
ncbi:unnamed protein product [Adineta steineri]|uniref:G-protein coupled receptors family 1 profile domain-containing protein n=1 Tax=Adineta steineri TaxID=433720 RepID=A0A816DAP6_9BILA|nr:unnamed protein product [Adineta steineri]CAF1634781.1 unnamed protein product [Adineta steineri]